MTNIFFSMCPFHLSIFIFSSACPFNLFICMSVQSFYIFILLPSSAYLFHLFICMSFASIYLSLFIFLSLSFHLDVLIIFFICMCFSYFYLHVHVLFISSTICHFHPFIFIISYTCVGLLIALTNLTCVLSILLSFHQYVIFILLSFFIFSCTCPIYLIINMSLSFFYLLICMSF